MCQEFLSSAESQERAARLRAEEEAQQRAAAVAAEAEAAKYRWLQQRLVDRKVDIGDSSLAAKLLFQAYITSEEELAELSVDDFKTLLDFVITPQVFDGRAVILRTRLTAIHQEVKVRVQNDNILHP